MTLDNYEEVREAMEGIDEIARFRAREAWARLPDSARAALTQRQFDERLWIQSFGYELGRSLRRGISGPESARAAGFRALYMDQSVLDTLALEHVARVLAGQDSVLNLAAVAAFSDAATDQSVPKPLDAPRRTRRPHRVPTPFDGIIDRLWSDDSEGIRIGGVRLGGGLELAAGAVLLVLVWVPGTLAVTYRLLHRDVTLGNLAKAAIGWLGIVAVITWLLTPR